MVLTVTSVIRKIEWRFDILASLYTRKARMKV